MEQLDPVHVGGQLLGPAPTAKAAPAKDQLHGGGQRGGAWVRSLEGGGAALLLGPAPAVEAAHAKNWPNGGGQLGVAWGGSLMISSNYQVIVHSAEALPA